MSDATSPVNVPLWRRVFHTRLRDVLRGRFDASLDWQQAIARAEPPASLAEVTVKVVGGTRLWRGEKLDVANDLIAHFQDGLEFGHTPEGLLSTFGDPQAAAQLIRRAKRRNRSLAWRIWHYGWMTVVAILVLYVAMGLWMSFDQPTIRTDYLTVINKVPAAIPESERAWPIYRDAMLAMGMKQADPDSAINKILSSDAKPTDVGWRDKEKFLTKHAASIAKLREAAGHTGLGFVTSTSHADFTEKDRELFGVQPTPEQIAAAKHQTPDDHWTIDTLMPDLLILRQTGQLLSDDARRAAIAGDGQTAYDDVVALLGVSRHCHETPFLVATLVSEAVQGQARVVIRDVLAEHPAIWTDAQLRDLAHLLGTSRTDWGRGLEGERIGFYDSMQRVYTDDGSGDGRLALNVGPDQNFFQKFDNVVTGGDPQKSIYANQTLAVLMLPAANMTIASRKEMTELFDQLTSNVQDKLDEPYWKRAAQTRWDEEFRSLTSGPIGKYRYLFVDMLLPAYDAVLHRVTITDGERDGLLIGMALELYHRKHGKWPASLAELAPQYLPKLPSDTVTGKPLRYKIVDDRPVIYSVGQDSDDDGGRSITEPIEMSLWPRAQAQDGDWILWSTAKSK